jgi:hypothetical protein
MVCVFQTRQETAGAHSNERLGVGVSRTSAGRPYYNRDSRYSVGGFVKQGGRNAEDCAVNFDHLQTVSKGKIGSLIATLSSSKMQQMRSGLLFALGF